MKEKGTESEQKELKQIMSFLKNMQKVEQTELEQIWNDNFKDKSFPSNIDARILPDEEYLRVRNSLLYHIPMKNHTLAQTVRVNIDAELKEYGQMQNPLYANGLVVPIEEDGLKKYLILIREHPCNNSTSGCLVHELKHVYDKL
jgi:hypothetical protein